MSRRHRHLLVWICFRCRCCLVGPTRRRSAGLVRHSRPRRRCCLRIHRRSHRRLHISASAGLPPRVAAASTNAEHMPALHGQRGETQKRQERGAAGGSARRGGPARWTRASCWWARKYEVRCSNLQIWRKFCLRAFSSPQKLKKTAQDVPETRYSPFPNIPTLHPHVSAP